MPKEGNFTTHSYEVGQEVPVLEHQGCIGSTGVVQPDSSICCSTCKKSVFPDNQEYQRQRYSRKR
jgi:predicted nucleic acid-binding Zn ribbon protein